MPPWEAGYISIKTFMPKVGDYGSASSGGSERDQDELRTGARAGLRVIRATWEVLLPPNLDEESLDRAMANLRCSHALPASL